MGDGLKKITRRIKRLFVAEESHKLPPKLAASRVIAPEAVVPAHGKPAPRPTTRRLKVDDSLAAPSSTEFVKVEHLPWGVVHVIFIQPPVTVAIRDPITRRLDRRELAEGMKTTRIYYNKSGELLND